MSEALTTLNSTIHRDSFDVFYIANSLDGARGSSVLQNCPFCGTSLEIKDTHRLEGILSRNCIFEIHFIHGDIFDLSGCSPIDYSIYHERGGWSCTVDAFYSDDIHAQKFHRPGSGIDIRENDISKIIEKDSGTILYDLNTAEQDAAANP
jgi:hypothetical protein